MKPSINQGRWTVFASMVLALFLLPGCGGQTAKVVEGSVTIAGQTPDAGEIRFIPIEGTPGSNNVSMITDGRYRIKARGGVPIGKYRVEVSAKKKTGRQVMQDNGFEQVMSDEYIKISPPKYAGDQSPLTLEVTPDFDGKFDVTIE